MKKNQSDNSRRNFLANTAKGAAIIAISPSAAGSFLESFNRKKTSTGNDLPGTGFDQQPLPYSYDFAEDVIDAKTMEIHYTKHAAAYSKALKEAAQAEGADMSKPVEDILAKISHYSAKMRNNAGGHYNHEMFWKSMQPKTADNKPAGKLAAAIDTSFGSFAAFKTQFADAGKTRFGSGWAWLYLDASGKLKIGSTPNQDNPLMDISDIKGTPILGLDVWEHAYYLKYQNKRPDYIENWWNVVNWGVAGARFGG
jgi:Fe-Mn family superoxide dismutase